jgi:hypothetical protein
MAPTLDEIDAVQLLALSLDELRPSSREEAEHYLSWAFTEDEHERMEALLLKNSANTLTTAERAELEHFGLWGTRIDILQSRSRLLLHNLAIARA